MAFGTSFSPTSVMMKQPRDTGIPYVGIGKTGAGSVGPINAGPFTGGGSSPMPGPQGGGSTGAGTGVAQPQPSPNVLGPESVRATGKGPFDAAYRQNLATYGGGMYARPGGSMNFNPTDMSTFPGQPTGGGTAPVSGMPLSLLDMALGGQPFSFAPPQAAPQPSIQPNPDFNNLSDWLNQFWRNGRGMRAMA